MERGGEMGAERGLGRDQEPKKTLTQRSGTASAGKEPDKTGFSICITESLRYTPEANTTL